MKMPAALALVLLSIATLAAEKEIQVLKSTAQQLDELVSQKSPGFKEVVRPGFPAAQEKIVPVSLAKIAPAISARLKLPEETIRELLADDKTKLSQLTMARMIEESGGKPWKELLAGKKPDQLLQMVEERRLTARVKSVLDELYTEVSFAALDAMNRKADRSKKKNE